MALAVSSMTATKHGQQIIKRRMKMFHLPSKTQAMFCKICKDLENSLEVEI